MTQASTNSRGTTLAVTSGKGGVGKTNVVVNLAASLARLGHRVGILDADFGLGNIDVLLGLTPTYHLGHVLNSDRALDEVVIEGPLGIRILPAGTGIRALTSLTSAQWHRLRDVVRRFSAGLDFLVIDTGAGISDNVVELLFMAERVLVVTSDEPTAVVDAYAMVKILTKAEPGKELGLVVNGTRDAHEAGLVFRQLDTATTRFLKRSVRFYGFIVHDPLVRAAVLGQRAVVDHVPHAPASRCFRILASRLAGFSPGGGGGALRLAGPHAWPRPTIRSNREETVRCA